MAEAAFEAAERSPSWPAPAARLAALDAAGRVLFASARALGRFDAKDDAELERRLLGGEGPSARRLKRLAMSLPVGDAPRLERLNIGLGRRAVSLNVLCARAENSQGPVLLLWDPAAAARAGEESAQAADQVAAPAEASSVADVESSEVLPALAGEVAARPINPRFLWSLDKDGRFGAPDPTLSRALGANAPGAGETLEALAARISVEAGELMRVLEKRETFSDMLVLWPLPGERRQARIKLSAAPLYDRAREFTGFRGFGRIGETIEAPPHVSDALAGDIEEVHSRLRESAAAAPPAPPGEVAAAPPLFESGPPPAATGDEAAARAPSASATDPAAAEGECVAEAEQASAVKAEGLPPAPPRIDPAATGDTDGGSMAEESSKQGPTSWAPEPSREFAPAPERTAEIYVLRQSHAQPGKVVPIRPGALEPPPSLEGAPAGGPESVELSKSERDAFREIARALVGRPASPRADDAGVAPEPGPGRDRPELPEPSPAGEAQDDRRREVPAESAEMRPLDAAAILDRLPLGVMVVREARALYLNRTLVDLLGYRDFAHFEAADGLAGLFQGRDHEAVSGSDGAAQIPITRADGSLIAVDGRAQVVTWGGAPATLIALRPLTERLDRDGPPSSGVSRSRSGSADELQALLDHATDGAVTLDPAGRIVTLNRPAERLFGYEEKEVAGESVLMLLQPQSHPETTARLEALSREDAASPPSAPISVVGRDRAGRALTLALTLARIGSSEAPHFGALVRDLGREREVEHRVIAARDAALAASAAKTDFLAHVSHEIRTPLHAILGFAEVMMEERFGPVGNERYKDYLKDIHASGKHVMSLADDLLDLSKIEAGKFELAFTAVDANALIRECVSLMQPEAARERVIMRVSLFEQLPRVTADLRSLKQIMLNLISNAVKFNGPGGQVIVSTALDPTGQAVIRVRDTGVGMSESEVGVALEPFGRIAGQGRKRGAGLGLPLTKALVEANGAEFSIKSRREHGTLIEIAFSVAKAAE